jgi:hypothetical protein
VADEFLLSRRKLNPFPPFARRLPAISIKLNCMTIEDAKRIPITEWLASRGYQPARKHGEIWWYPSMLPDRAEHTPSFKVNTRINRWIDFGNGQKGSLIDLGILYHRCSITDFLWMLDKEASPSSGQRIPPPEPISSQAAPGIVVKEVKDLSDPSLLHYLRSRYVPLVIARAYCREIIYEVQDKTYQAIAFPSQSGGYELRNAWFKGTIAPKDSSRIIHGHSDLAVFEGFFDFLSYQTLQTRKAVVPETLRDYVILNSTAFWQKNIPEMLRYDCVYLYLDRDEAGQKLTRKALELAPGKFVDHSPFYARYKGLNEYLIRTTQRPHQRHSLGP